MIIQSTSFGQMVINDTLYTTDLVIYPDGQVEDSWRRSSGHRLSVDDIDRLIKSDCEVIVAGTGVNGLMQPEPSLKTLLDQKGIKFIAEPTPKAVQTFNALFPTRPVGACFHLTC